MSDPSDADRSFREAAAFYFDLARTRGNLGISLGQWDHPRHGRMRVLAVNGWIGARYVTLVCCATEAELAQERYRLWWYLGTRAEPFEFKPRTPEKETAVHGALAMRDAVLKEIERIETEGDGHG